MDLFICCWLHNFPGGSTATTLPSYTLDLATVIKTHAVDNILHIQFLHGYNQPTLLILYEPLKTFAGRIAVRKDTCRLDVVTLDVNSQGTPSFLGVPELSRNSKI